MKFFLMTRTALPLLSLLAAVGCSGSATDTTTTSRQSDVALDDPTHHLLVKSDFPGAGTSGAGAALTAGLTPETALDCVPTPDANTVGADVADKICLYGGDASAPAAI